MRQWPPSKSSDDRENGNLKHCKLAYENEIAPSSSFDGRPLSFAGAEPTCWQIRNPAAVLVSTTKEKVDSKSLEDSNAAKERETVGVHNTKGFHTDGSVKAGEVTSTFAGRSSATANVALSSLTSFQVGDSEQLHDRKHNLKEKEQEFWKR